LVSRSSICAREGWSFQRAAQASETPGELKWLGADTGQHNDEIYCGRLGVSAEEIERLKRGGII